MDRDGNKAKKEEEVPEWIKSATNPLESALRLVGKALVNGSKKSQTEKKPNNNSDIKQNIDPNTKQVDESG